MKSSKTTNTLLAIIAINLCFLSFMQMVPAAKASSKVQYNDVPQKVILVGPVRKNNKTFYEPLVTDFGKVNENGWSDPNPHLVVKTK